MSLLFGKKKRSSRKGVSTKKVVKRPKALNAALRKLAKKFRVRTRITRGGKLVGYRKISHIKKDISRKMKKAAKKLKVKKAKKSTRKGRRSAFGVGGSYMPLSSFMSPYPYSVDSSPPWV